MADRGTNSSMMRRIANPLGSIDDLATAYKKLQLLTGALGITLVPVVVLIDEAFGDHPGLRDSVSSYYYGRAGNWFVGALSAMAVFLFTYQYTPQDDTRTWDNVQSTIAAIAMLGVALFPVPSDPPRDTTGEQVVGVVHFVSATVLFILLAIFSLYHFTKTKYEYEITTTLRHKLFRVVRTDWDAIREQWATQPASARDPQPFTREKVARNVVYRVCGWVIVASLLGAVAGLVSGNDLLFFWSEVVAVTTFGISWLVKGGAVWFVND